MQARLAGIAADQNAWTLSLAFIITRLQMHTQRITDTVKRCVIERILAGDSPDAVGAEKLFCHGVLVGALG